MNSNNFAVIILAACSLLLSAACAETTQAKPDRTAASYPLPEIKKDCSICHLPAGTSKPQELKKKLSQLCLDCHSDRAAPAEHRVDIVPKMEVKGLPLTDGKMTCFTCHDAHANTYGKMLRMPARDLCFACHPL